MLPGSPFMASDFSILLCSLSVPLFFMCSKMCDFSSFARGLFGVHSLFRASEISGSSRLTHGFTGTPAALGIPWDAAAPAWLPPPACAPPSPVCRWLWLSPPRSGPGSSAAAPPPAAPPGVRPGRGRGCRGAAGGHCGPLPPR